MSDWDFSQTSSADLATMQANVVSKINALLTGVQSGSNDGAQFSEMKLDDLKSLQGALDAEVRLRADATGGFISCEFEEAS